MGKKGLIFITVGLILVVLVGYFTYTYLSQSRADTNPTNTPQVPEECRAEHEEWYRALDEFEKYQSSDTDAYQQLFDRQKELGDIYQTCIEAYYKKKIRSANPILVISPEPTGSVVAE